MKYLIIIIAFFSFSFSINADDFHCSETILINEGYTKFDPTIYYDTHILDDCYEKIFNKNRFERKGSMRILFNDDDGIVYNLYYILEEEYKIIEQLPNILVIAYLENEDKMYGYYKMNLNLEAEEEVSTTLGNLLIFY